MGGDKKGGGDSTPAAEAQMRLAQQLMAQTAPIRSALIGRSSAFLGAPNSQMMMPSTPMDSGGGGMLSRAFDQIINGPAQQAGAVGPAGTGFGDVTATPTYNAFRDTANRTFQQGRDNAIARLPAGGALTEALVNLEGDRASTLTQGAASIYNDELARAMALGTGITGQSMSGLGQAAATQAAMAQANANQKAGMFGALGSGLGAYAGLKA